VVGPLQVIAAEDFDKNDDVGFYDSDRRDGRRA